jgi:hypothetical protein
MRRLSLALAFASAAVATLAPATAGAASHVYRGRIEIRHSDDFAHMETQTSYLLVQGKHRIPLVPAQEPSTPSGSKVIVRGKRTGRSLHGSVRPRGILHAAAVQPGARKTAVILINFASDTSEPWTPDEVRQHVFTASDSASAFYSEESYGDVWLTGNDRADGDVYGWYTITPAAAGCNTSDWAGKAKQKAAAQGFLPANYQHVIYAFPYQASCGGWAGLGELPGRQSWMNGDISTRVVAHELGHNMGLHHASSLTCTAGGTKVAYSSSCTPDEYGDPFDVMGNSPRHNNAWHLRQIGIMPGTNVTVVSSSGTYTLSSAISPGTAGQTQLLRVPIPDSSPQSYYDLELRAAGGVFDNFLTASPALTGVTIHVDGDPFSADIKQSELIDATPGSSSGFSDAPLAVGRTFSYGAVSIAVSAVSAGTATVDVVTGPAPDAVAPSVPGPVTATPEIGRVSVSWPAATDDVGVAGYRVYRDNVLKATVTTLQWVDTAVIAGRSYNYRVAAFDAAGNVATSAPVIALVPAPPPATASATVAPPGSATPPGATGSDPHATTAPPPDPAVAPPPPPDTIRPFVTIDAPARRALARRRSWLRSTARDASGVVRSELWVDGVRRKTVHGSRIAWRLSHLRRGRHMILVRAYDAAGNHGKASVRVRIVR